MIRGVDDLLEDLGAPPRDQIGMNENLPDYERRAFDALSVPSLPDAVARTAGLSIPEAVGALIRLELAGLARSVGGRYERTYARS